MRNAKRRSFGRRSTRWILPLLALATLAWASGPVFAGTPAGGIKGKVTGWEKLLPRVYADASKDDGHRYTWREPSPTVKQDFRKLSANASRDVCVVALTSGNAPAHEPIEVKVTGGRITPATIVLSPGSRLSFKNFDPFPHQLYEVGRAAWAPNPTAPGSTREWAASSTGVHEIRDELFPSIVMYVVVDVQAAEYALPDRDGGFSMSLAPGEYTLKVFFDGKLVSRPLDGLRVDGRGLDIKEPISLSGGDAK